MEEQQIQEFVQRVCEDGKLRQELQHDPAGVIEREHFSPTVVRVLKRLVPQLGVDSPADIPTNSWWM